MFKKILDTLSMPFMKALENICKSLVSILSFIQKAKDEKNAEKKKTEIEQSNNELKDICDNGSLQDLIKKVNK